jgi:hypothetical protein
MFKKLAVLLAVVFCLGSVAIAKTMIVSPEGAKAPVKTKLVKIKRVKRAAAKKVKAPVMPAKPTTTVTPSAPAGK